MPAVETKFTMCAATVLHNIMFSRAMAMTYFSSTLLTTVSHVLTPKSKKHQYIINVNYNMRAGSRVVSAVTVFKVVKKTLTFDIHAHKKH